jgi:hypothetical protein
MSLLDLYLPFERWRTVMHVSPVIVGHFFYGSKFKAADSTEQLE